MSKGVLGSRILLYGCALIVICAFAGRYIYEQRVLTDAQNQLNVKISKRVPVTGEVATYLVPLDEIMKKRSIGKPRAVYLTVDKSDRLLRLFINGSLVKTYVIGLGTNPVTKKIREGDCATPEGDYYICSKSHSYHRALAISYPNARDAKRGLENKLIDRSQYLSIKSANDKKESPPMDTKLGGLIAIHGGGAGLLIRNAKTPYIKVYDRTQGCVAMRNRDIEELYKLLPIKTPVHIAP